jgi:HSP20 family protein
MADKPTPVPVAGSAPAAQAPAPTARRRDWPSLADLRREMDSLFDEFTRDIWSVPARLGRMEPFARFDLTPAVDVVEVDGAFKVTLEVPGMTEKDLEVRIDDDMLVVRGEKSESRDETEKGRHVQERRYGSFERSFTLPAGVDRARIDASCANGVLTVTLPKSAEAKAAARKIDVKAA